MGVSNSRPGGTSGFITPTGVESVQNKDIDGGVASNTSRITVPKAARATLDALTRKEGTVVYDTTADKLLYDNGTQLAELGSGSGELNLIENPSDSNNWSETGTVFSTPVTTTTAGDLPLGGLTDTAIQLVASGNGAEASHYNSYSFTTPASLSGKMKVEFYQRPGTGFAESEWTVSVYQGSTRQSLSTDSSGVTYLVNASNKRTVYVDLLASTAYTLRFARVAGSGSATLNISNVIVGPGIQPQGAVVGEWQSYTPTLKGATNGTTFTNQTTTGKYRRVGDTCEFEVATTFSGAPGGGTGAFLWTLPNGITIDSTKIVENRVNGNAFVNNSTDIPGSSTQGLAAPVYIEAGGFRILYLEGGTNNDYLSASHPDPWVNTDFIRATGSFPIAEWAGSGTTQLAQNDVEYAYNTNTANSADTSSFGYGPGGVAFGSYTSSGGTGVIQKRVRFQTPIQPGDNIVLEYNYTPFSTGWQQFEQSADISGRMSTNANTYGGYWELVSGSTTDIEVSFANGGRRANNTANFTSGSASSGAPWSDLTTAKWRVRKSSAGAAVGFGIADTNSSGLVPSGTYNKSTGAWTLGPATNSLTHTLNANNVNIETSGSAAASLNLRSTGGNSAISFNNLSNGTPNRFNINYLQSSDSLTIANANGTTTIASATQAGAWTLGNSTSSVTHRFESAIAAGSMMTQVVKYTGGDTASNYYMEFATNTAQQGYIWNNASGNLELVTSSDVNLKENIRPANYGLEQVLALNPVVFDWKSGKAFDVKGFIAQEVEVVLPECVSQGQDGIKMLGKDAMIPVLVKAIQELKDLVDTQTAELDAAKARIATLEGNS
jgi:hypothetical protein